jgi:hypothetical protein
LSEALVKSWRMHNQTPTVPSDEDELLYARRLVVQRCIYGVDKNPMAVDLAKLSLWLSTFAKDHSFTFLDHSLKCGDSLVGLNLEQIARGSWSTEGEQNSLFTHKVREVVDEYIELRYEIANASEGHDYDALVILNEEAQQRVQRLRAAGDLVLSAFVNGSTDRERRGNLLQVQGTLLKIFQMDADFKYGSVLGDDLHSFHWQLEFPEVFRGSRSGFDIFIGNPPFLGGKRISGSLGKTYSDLIVCLYEGTSGNTDLCGFFFRNAWNLISPEGALGFIATNTISQGDTRRASLVPIVTNGGRIFAADKRVQWPGEANVIVSTIIIDHKLVDAPILLNHNIVSGINSHLLGIDRELQTTPLLSNRDLVYTGSDVKGQGFIIDDNDGEAITTLELESVFAKEPESKKLIFRYIGGEDLNLKLSLRSRLAINFGVMPISEAEHYKLLLNLVKGRVVESRSKQARELQEIPFWQYWRPREELYSKLSKIKYAIAIAQTSNAFAFDFIATPAVFSHTAIVFPTESYAIFAVLQSSLHQAWAFSLSATMKDDFRYIPSDCFVNFPFYCGIEGSSELEEFGLKYFNSRKNILKMRDIGLGDFYSLFNDPLCSDTEILSFRDLHNRLNKMVLHSYGWSDAYRDCDFFLDFIEEDSENEPTSRKSKKPWRYRWPDSIRDEVLARLLDLNAKRAEEETLAAPKEEKKKRKSK